MRYRTVGLATLFFVLALASPALAVNITNVSIASPSAAASARTVYRVTLKTTGGLTGAQQLRVMLPADTSAPRWQSGTLHDNTRDVDVGSCDNPDATDVSTCRLFSGAFMNPNDELVVTLRGITN